MTEEMVRIGKIIENNTAMIQNNTAVIEVNTQQRQDEKNCLERIDERMDTLLNELVLTNGYV